MLNYYGTRKNISKEIFKYVRKYQIPTGKEKDYV